MSDLRMTGEQLADVLEKSLDDLLEGAKEDVREYALEISQDLVAAAARNRVDLMQHLQGQLAMLADRNRVRIAQGALQTVNKVITTLFNVLLV